MNDNRTESGFWLMIGYGLQLRSNTEYFAVAEHTLIFGRCLTDAGVSL